MRRCKFQTRQAIARFFISLAFINDNAIGRSGDILGLKKMNWIHAALLCQLSESSCF
jgi:hypothetical protein